MPMLDEVTSLLLLRNGGGSRVGGGGQGRCEQRSEVFVKIKKKIVGGGSVRAGGGGVRVRGGQGGCE